MSDWILVVDDDVSNLKMASRILSSENLRVSCMKSGEDAILFLQDNRPDLILLDYEMPGMDGRETFMKIKENLETRNIPVLFLTGISDKAHIYAALELEPAGYILKPAAEEKLFSQIEQALAEKKKTMNQANMQDSMDDTSLPDKTASQDDKNSSEEAETIE